VRIAAGHDASQSLRRFLAGPADQALHLCVAFRIVMSSRHPAKRAIGFEYIDAARRSQVRNHQAGQRGDRMLIVER